MEGEMGMQEDRVGKEEKENEEKMKDLEYNQKRRWDRGI